MHRPDSVWLRRCCSLKTPAGEHWLSHALSSPLLYFPLFSLSPLSFSLPSSTSDAQFTESVISRHSGGSGWSTAQAMAQPPGLRSGQLRLAETATACISEASPGALSQLSRALSLGPLRLCFLLSLGSYWEEQGQVPGKSPKMPGSFLVACRGLSGLLPGIPVCSSSSQSLCRSWCWWGGQA